ncbi:kinase-like protein [Lophium mytilinum]|uniref:non-specific serine/threonine protein kinase n=1 Tax=Lophium mytilinum TaxID=390894 RepID=A0A6A6R522_9PEZI|nr:kinase-like protein [Lophium mytilinum]
MLRKARAGPNIVQILGHKQNYPEYGDQTLFLEYCSHGDLVDYKSYVHRRNAIVYVPEELIWHVYIQLSEALDFLHYGPPNTERGDWRPIVHFDIKGSNILVAPGPTDMTPQIKLADFSRSGTPDHTHPSGMTIVGTEDYLPPEQPHINHKGDVWAVGCVIHWLALNAPPYNHREHQIIFQRYRKASSETQNAEMKLKLREDYRRECEGIPRVMHPIDLSIEEWLATKSKDQEQRVRWHSDSAKKHIPRWSYAYSSVLNAWMMKALQTLPQDRATARRLVSGMIPVGKRAIEAIQKGSVFDVDGDGDIIMG